MQNKEIEILNLRIIIIILTLLNIIIPHLFITNNKPVVIDKSDSITVKSTSFINKTPEEGLKEALEYHNIMYPNIVYSQAILETGNFNSDLCKNHNNLFGLYNSSKGEYYKYNHWVESVEDYKNYIQNKYKGGNYYNFLINIGYAEDPYYTVKLKQIINGKRNNNK